MLWICQQVVSKLCPSDQICFCFAVGQKQIMKKKLKELSREIPGIISPCRWLYLFINDVTSILANPCKISPDSNAVWALSLHNERRCFRVKLFLCINLYVNLYVNAMVCDHHMHSKELKGEISLFYRFLNVCFVHLSVTMIKSNLSNRFQTISI